MSASAPKSRCMSSTNANALENGLLLKNGPDALKESLCARLSEIHDALMSRPSLHHARVALDFLVEYRMALTTAFELSAWTFAMCQQEPSVGWDEVLSRVVSALSHVLRTPTRASWQNAHNVWAKFYLSIASGGCARLPDGDVGARYVVRPSPPSSPFNGQLFCVPTLTPALITERSYANRMECELALSMLPRGNIASMDSVYCNEYGCSRVPEWSNVPQYGLTCNGRGCCGSSNGSSESSCSSPSSSSSPSGPSVYRNYPYMG